MTCALTLPGKWIRVLLFLAVPFASIHNARADADLSVTITDSADPAPHATNFFYTIRVENLGPGNATGVVVTNPLPPELAFAGASVSQGSLLHASGVVTWNLGAVANEGNAVAVIQVSSVISGFVMNEASVSAVEADPDPVNNTAAEGTFLGLADLGVTISDSPDPVVAGSLLTNVITVTNLGPDIATSAGVTFSLHAGAVPVSASLSQGTLTQSGETFDCDFGNLPVGAVATLVVRAIPTAVEPHVHNAMAAGAEADPEFGNDSDEETTTVLAGPGVLQFASSLFTTGENAGAVTIGVQRIGGAVGTVGVSFATANFTAVAGVDFAATNGTLLFANGQTQKVFTVTLLNNSVLECNEEFRVNLFNPTGGAIALPPTNATVRISDDDLPATGQLTAMSITVTNPFLTANDGSFDTAVSDNGRFVVFSSGATDLVPDPDANFSADVFLHDRLTGSNRLVSANMFGTAAGDSFSSYAQVSADGSRVVFYSVAANLAPNDVNGTGDVFIRDTDIGLTDLVSLDQTGTGSGNDISANADLTPDGRFVVFESAASNLSPADGNGPTVDIFLRDMTTNAVELINVSPSGGADADSYNPAVSDDGRFVAFESAAGNLGPADGNGQFDIYVRDRQNGTNLLCSRNLAGTDGGNDYSFNAFISANGRTVVFTSQATNLVANDTNGVADLFAFDTLTHTLQAVSVNTNGVPGDYPSLTPSVSADGRYVAFRSDASDLVPGDSNGHIGDVFVRDLLAGTTTLVSVDCESGGSGSDYSIEPQISADGRCVVFESYAWNLTAGDYSAGVRNVFRRDLVTGTTAIVSRNVTGIGGGELDSAAPRLSADGSVVAFGSQAQNLFATDANGFDDVFAWFAPVPPVVAPVLSAEMINASQLRISWPASTPNVFTVESTANLAPLSAWTAVTNAVSDNGTIRFIVVDIQPGGPGRYYRLKN